MDYEAEIRAIVSNLPGFEPVGAWMLTSVAETADFGAALGSVVSGGTMIALIGPMGAGKTHLVKGLAARIAGTDPSTVRSPTFTLLHTYRGRAAVLFHMDWCRIGGSEEVPSDVSDALEDRAAVSAVEWAEVFPELWPDRVVLVWLAYGEGENERVARLWARGVDAAALRDAIGGTGVAAA